MKYSLALPALVASTFAGAIPGEAHKHIQRRAADLQSICSFEDHTFDDTNAWDNITPANTKRDLSQTKWNPPSNLVTPLKQVWDHELATYTNALGFKNYGYDQVLAAKGKINYCVWWRKLKANRGW